MNSVEVAVEGVGDRNTAKDSLPLAARGSCTLIFFRVFDYLHLLLEASRELFKTEKLFLLTSAIVTHSQI